jgi:DNA-binding transcriptional MerR regulator
MQRGDDMERKRYSIGQVARHSGVSVRTLHHFESMGLLSPKRQDNGYRVYGSEDIERLEHILLYRACGVELADIGTILDAPEFDARAALASHLKTLRARKQNLESLIATVEKTLQSLEEGTPMTDNERFEEMKQAAIAANEAKYGAEARKRWGNAAVDEANERLLGMDEAAWNDMAALEEGIIQELKKALTTGDTHGAHAERLARMHARWIQLHWGEAAYSREAHLQLAQGYLADKRFTAYYDERAGKGATEFLVAALNAWI